MSIIFKVGDKVKYIGDVCTLKEKTGTIFEIAERSFTSTLLCVKWDKFNRGHNGTFSKRFSKGKNCWNVFRTEVVLVIDIQEEFDF